MRACRVRDSREMSEVANPSSQERRVVASSAGAVRIVRSPSRTVLEAKIRNASVLAAAKREKTSGEAANALGER
jgi:alpha-ketoglutarate-dependent taurine dioxygenase